MSDSSEWDPEDLAQLRAAFYEEGLGHIATLTRAAAQLSSTQATSPHLAHEARALLLRTLHTFKGAAGSVALDALHAAAHSLEEKLLALSVRELPIPSLIARQIADAIEDLSADVAAIATSSERRAEERRRGDRRDETSVRVDAERLDALVAAASELIFDHTRISRRVQEFEGSRSDLEKLRSDLQHLLLSRPLFDDPAALGARLSEITTDLSLAVSALARATTDAAQDAESLTRTSRRLQESVRHVRMMRVGQLMQRLRPTALEASRREDKEVDVITIGEETEIDKAVVERVAEPLEHLIRNAVAHGIESPDVRRQKGKPARGVITFSARQEGDSVELIVADDGAGIDRDRVRARLVTLGHATQAAAAALDETALIDALFLPGFSTRDDADAIAGRGIGLDAVRSAVDRLGGSIQVESSPETGTRFSLRLPLATAIEEYLLFKVGGQVYGVPSAAVDEAVQVTADDLEQHEAHDRLRLRDGYLPLVRLGALFGEPPPPGRGPTRVAVILRYKNTRFAITCDKVVGPREVVVRNLGPFFEAVPLYSGATISGAGKVQLLLDLSFLSQQAARGLKAVRPARAQGPRRVLVVDDSRSAREAALLILHQSGYAAEAVPDGFDAWEVLQDRPFDLLLTDLEMPRLDGIELLERVRGSDGLRDLPVVVVSSRTEAPVRDAVSTAGANAFVGKPLRRRALLDAVESALNKR